MIIIRWSYCMRTFCKTSGIPPQVPQSQGEYIPPNRAKSPDFSDPNHHAITKKGKCSITKILMYYVSAAVFTLHSGHVENVSRARYTVNHQSRNFDRA